MIRLIGMHNLPYSLLDQASCAKAIKIFNMLLDDYILLLEDFPKESIDEELKQRFPIGIETGGSMNTVILIYFIEKHFKEDIKDRIIKKVKASRLPQNRMRAVFELRDLKFYEAIATLTYVYWKIKRKLPDWKQLLKIDSDSQTILKEKVIRKIQKEFSKLLTEEELIKVSNSLNALNRGSDT